MISSVPGLGFSGSRTLKISRREGGELLRLLSSSSANVAQAPRDCRKGYYLNEKETAF